MASKEINFYQLACPVLGGLLGLLISLPLSFQFDPKIVGTAIIIVFTLLGAKIGYKNRENKVFMYIMIVGILVLASLFGAR